MEIQRSEGHICFTEKHEYVQVGDSVYRAWLADPITHDGCRGGLRWVGSLEWWREWGHLYTGTAQREEWS